MKSTLHYIALGGLFLLLLAGCDDDDKNTPVILPAETGTFTDPRDGVEYNWVRYGDLEWMTENLRAEADTSVWRVYVNDYQTDEEEALQEQQNFSKYGYWYDYAAALSAIPDGWRLPTDEDWQKLEQLLGMPQEEINQMAWRGDIQGEILQQNTGLALLPGGFIDYKQLTYGVEYSPAFIEFYGFFWSSSQDETASGNARIYRQIRYNSQQIGRFSTRPEKLMHVRCVRDAAGQ